jgi:hypothetical protein
MADYGAGGVLLSRQVPLGWGCGRTSENFGFHYLDSLGLSWGMAPRSAFDMICGVGT